MRTAGAYVARRLAVAVPLLWLVSVIAYVLLYRAADPVERLRRIPGVRPADVARLVREQGLDQPWYAGYWSWLTGFLHGDWGLSATRGGADALTVIGDALPATIELMGLATVVSAVLAVALGVLSAARPGSARDHAIGVACYVGFATPTFLAGVLLQLGAIWMRDHGWAVLPFALGTALLLAGLAGLRGRGARRAGVAVAGGILIVLSIALWGRLGGGGETVLYTGQRYSFGHEGQWWSLDHLQHLVLPVITLALVNVAVWTRFQRAELIEELRSDHIAHARARGLSDRRVMLRHALRNGLMPLVTLVALDLGAMFSGAVVTETVFSWPGMGRLLRDAAVDRDINVAMGIVMIGAVAVVVAGIAADLTYAALDPRVDLRGRQ